MLRESMRAQLCVSSAKPCRVARAMVKISEEETARREAQRAKQKEALAAGERARRAKAGG